MPRIKPEFYEGMPPADHLSLAVGMTDPTTVWNLLKGGLKPDSGHLTQITHSTHFTLETDKSPFKSQPGGSRGYNRQLQKLTKMLFAAGADPLKPVEVSSPDGTESTQHVLPAQSAFAAEPSGRPATGMGALSTIVLETLKAKPDWKPDFGHIFRNIIGPTPEEEAKLRRAQARHIHDLGHTVMGRLRGDGTDKLGCAAYDALRDNWWVSGSSFSIKPDTMPKPTQAMRDLWVHDKEWQLTAILAVIKAQGPA